MELSKRFSEKINCITIHPDGLFLVAGFSNKIKFLNILIDDLRVFNEILLRECKVVQFSNSGHIIAIAIKDTIHLYNTITFDTIHVLKGHQGEVKCLSWTNDDLKLVSCALNGSIYDWQVASGERINELVVRTCSFTSLTVTPDGFETFAVGSDSTLKHISRSRILQELDLHSFTLSAIALSHNGKMLVSGTTTGGVLIFKYPLSLPAEWKEYKIHGGTVTSIKISFTNDVVVTASEDGSFCIWKLLIVSVL